MATILLIDGTNQFIRNYVTYSSTTTNGEPYGGVVGFLRSLTHFVEITRPYKVIVVFDAPGGSKRRKQIYKEYKQGRKRPTRLNRQFEIDEDKEEQNKKWQVVKLVDYLCDLPVSIVIVEDIEADDAIAYMSQYYPDDKKVIVSTDHDFYQLLDDKTEIYKPSQREFYTMDQCLKDYGIHPKNFAVARAMIGDRSDNIKGIKGIGFKTVLKYFPQLVEPEPIEINDLLEWCSKDPDAKYKLFAQNRELILANYSIMSLSEPIISAFSISKIKSCIKEAPTVNNTGLKLKLMKDGINLGNIFPTFLTLSVAGKTKNVKS